LKSKEERQLFLQELVHAYLLKDILTIDGIRRRDKLLSLLRLLALQIGSQVSNVALGHKLGLDKKTVNGYLGLLTKVFIIHPLGCFSQKLRK
jgi:predicted AAA+ superfamily ATPase